MIVQHELEAEISRLRRALESIAEYPRGRYGGLVGAMRNVALNALAVDPGVGMPRSVAAPQQACERAQGASSVPSCPLLDAKIVEAGARAVAGCFGYDWVFESDTTEENYDAAYWRHVARSTLAAAVGALDPDELLDRATRALAGGWTSWPAEIAYVVLAAIGLLPAEHREETG